jgi:predicted nucleic acid-binding protein
VSSIVSNASPLIVLAKAGLLDLLPKLFSEVVIPEAVRDEVRAGPVDDPARISLPGCGWMRIAVLEPPLSPLAAIQLGRGEAEVIECARRQTDGAVLLDDRAGRRVAKALRLRVLGTLSLAALAAQLGHIVSFDDAVTRLRAVGLYASDSVVEAVRRGLRT